VALAIHVLLVIAPHTMLSILMSPVKRWLLYGILGIMAQHFVVTVYNGISDEIREHGFSLGSLFRGLGRGLGRFFKSLTKLKGLFGFAYYGNYCGASNPNQSAGREPIDELDAACLEHDRVYQSTRDNRERARADRRLALAALRAGLRGRLSRTGNFFALFTFVIFGITGLVRPLFGSSKESQEPETVNVSWNDGKRPILSMRSQERYRTEIPAYPEIMNSAPLRIDRFRHELGR